MDDFWTTPSEVREKIAYDMKQKAKAKALKKQLAKENSKIVFEEIKSFLKK